MEDKKDEVKMMEENKIQIEKAHQKRNNMDKFFKNTQGMLHSHSAIAPFGSPNTVYTVHSLHFALPYFVPLRSAKHRIY